MPAETLETARGRLPDMFEDVVGVADGTGVLAFSAFLCAERMFFWCLGSWYVPSGTKNKLY